LENDGVRQTNALLRLFFKVEPNELSDEDYAGLTAEMWWALKATGKVELKDGNYRFIS
jgi:hypothetical protein